MANQSHNPRKRVWATIAYPESVADGWREILENEFNIPTLISPLHDEDIDPNNNAMKGSH